VSDIFFRELSSIHELGELCDGRYSELLPEKWTVVVVDVKNSTKAIEKGEYKSVNSVGVASIAAVLNACEELFIPYAFGGDGATFCIPNKKVEEIKGVLLATRKMALDSFGLTLRIGFISIENIRQAGFDILVGKYRISDFCSQAFFSGGGVTYAEEVIKNDQLPYQVKDADTNVEANYQGFECRWKNIPSPFEETLSYLIKIKSPSADSYSRILDKVEEIYGNAHERHPLRPAKMKLSFDFFHLKNEYEIKTFNLEKNPFFYYLKMLLQNLIGVVCMRCKVKHEEISWGDYKFNAIENTDVCKFDDMLRFVVSGTSKQRQMMEAYLEEEYKNEKLVYGQHIAHAAMMTCYVKDYSHNHCHFIDGADGGYALAALDFKKRMKV
jgi:hypothetical protein